MKKWLVVGTLGGLVLVLFVLPVLVGFALERAYPALLENAREQVGERFRVEGSLDRGLLASASETTLIPAADDGIEHAIRLRHRWGHGPFAVAQWHVGGVPLPPVLAIVRTAVEPEGLVAPSIVDGLAGRPLVEVEVRMNIDGRLDIVAQSPAFEAVDAGFASQGTKTELRVDGGVRGARGRADVGALRLDSGRGRLAVEASTIRFHGAHTAAGSRVDGDFDLGTARLVAESGGALAWAPSHGTFKLARAPNELDTSSLVVELGEAEIIGAGNGSRIPGKIRGGHLQLDVRSAARRVVRLEAVFALDALVWGEESFGPGLVRVALRDVDLAAADSFRDALETLAAAGDSGGAPLEAEARLLGEWLPALVRTSPEFEIERFELTGWGGKLEGEGFVKVDGSDPGAFARESSAMEAIEARARLAMPVPLVDALLDGFLLETVQAEGAGLPREEILAMVAFLREMALARLRETGVLRREGERYDVLLRFEQGVLIVNGKLLGPGGLMGLLTGG